MSTVQHELEPGCSSDRINDVAEPLLPKGESALTSGEYIGSPCFAGNGSIWAGFLSTGAAPGGIVARLLPAP